MLTKNVNNYKKYRSQDLAKAILPIATTSRRALAVEGLTDDVKKGGNGPKAIHALKEKEVEEIPADGAFDHNYHGHQALPADDDQRTCLWSSKKGYKLHDRIYAQPW